MRIRILQHRLPYHSHKPNWYTPVSYTHLDVYKRQGVGCGIASLICGIIAIVLGNKARPLGRAIAGFVLGIVGSSLSGSTILIAYVIKMLI